MNAKQLKDAIAQGQTRARLLHQQAEATRKKSPVKAAQIAKDARAEDARVLDLRAKLSAMTINTLVEFEDNGQDFLKWLVAPSGEVIDCAPMQAAIWVGKMVVGTEGQTPGKEYLVLASPDGDVRLKHAVKSITRANVQSLQELEDAA